MPPDFFSSAIALLLLLTTLRSVRCSSLLHAWPRRSDRGRADLPCGRSLRRTRARARRAPSRRPCGRSRGRTECHNAPWSSGRPSRRPCDPLHERSCHPSNSSSPFVARLPSLMLVAPGSPQDAGAIAQPPRTKPLLRVLTRDPPPCRHLERVGDGGVGHVAPAGGVD